jgi:hypothetical protein
MATMASSTKQSKSPATVAKPEPSAAEKRAMAKAAKEREAEQRQLADLIAKLRADKVAWDGEGGIVDQGLVRSATTGRALLRRFNLTDKAGGIGPSYDREAARKAREAAASK